MQKNYLIHSSTVSYKAFTVPEKSILKFLMPLRHTSNSIMKVSSSITPEIVRKPEVPKGFLIVSGGNRRRDLQSIFLKHCEVARKKTELINVPKNILKEFS